MMKYCITNTIHCEKYLVWGFNNSSMLFSYSSYLDLVPLIVWGTMGSGQLHIYIVHQCVIESN